MIIIKKWFNNSLIKLRARYTKLSSYFRLLVFWQLFLTIFWFSFANLILLIIAGLLWLTSLFLII